MKPGPAGPEVGLADHGRRARSRRCDGLRSRRRRDTERGHLCRVPRRCARPTSGALKLLTHAPARPRGRRDRGTDRRGRRRGAGLDGVGHMVLVAGCGRGGGGRDGSGARRLEARRPEEPHRDGQDLALPRTFCAGTSEVSVFAGSGYIALVALTGRTDMAYKFLLRALSFGILLFPAVIFGCGSNGTVGRDAMADHGDADGRGGSGMSGSDGAAGVGGGGVAGASGVGGIGGTGGSGGASGGISGSGGSVGVDGGSGADGGEAGPDSGDTANDVIIDTHPDGGGIDAGPPPNPPTNLSATVLNRRGTSFQLGWAAPATSLGGQVTGYQARYAKVPITAGNFDDTTSARENLIRARRQPSGNPTN